MSASRAGLLHDRRIDCQKVPTRAIAATTRLSASSDINSGHCPPLLIAPTQQDDDCPTMPGTNVQHTSQFLFMAIAASLALTACNEREPAALVAENVREARGEAEENLSKARRQAGDVMAETGPQLGSADADVRGAALEDRAEANYDVALVEAAGAREVALERCDGLSATAQFDCKQRVEREYDAAKAAARAELAVQRERAEQIAERDDLY